MSLRSKFKYSKVFIIWFLNTDKLVKKPTCLYLEPACLYLEIKVDWNIIEKLNRLLIETNKRAQLIN